MAAYLHDPPEKPYDFGPAHQAAARKHAASFGVAELWDALSHSPDWSAAAADRFIFPDGRKEGVGGLGEDGRVAFVHPMSGRADKKPSWKVDDFPTAEDAGQWIGDIRPDWKDSDAETLFLKAWRLWMEHAASHASGQGRGAEALPFLPADTRIPDASIWHHCAVVSAIEATRPKGNVNALPRPAFLLFQVGPVQEFIAQARSTRDLRNGSYLISWLMMHAIKAVADWCGPDALIFPSLRGQPIYEWLQRKLELKPDQQAALTPGIPNRFLALVPEGFDAAAVVEVAFKNEWERIARECAAWLKLNGANVETNPLWQEQIEQHWHLTWQLWPWQTAEDALVAFKLLPLGHDNAIRLASEVALAIPEAHRDERCYRKGKLDPGWAWSAHYQLCQHALDARRNLRDFKASAFDATRKSAHRDAFSGREEAVIEQGQLENLAKNQEIGHLFRHSDPLGAANLVKRVWHKAYLARLSKVRTDENLENLIEALTGFDSVPAVAAGEWRAKMREMLPCNADLWHDLISLSERLAEAQKHLPSIVIPAAINRGRKEDESEWLDRIDGETFTKSFWESLLPEVQSQLEVQEASRAVAEFKKRHKLGEPPSYYAILALDGDQIGKWLSGERTPLVRDVLAPKAVEYFEKTMPEWYRQNEGPEKADQIGSKTRKWLESPRPLSPSWHLQFSEALANFGLHAARRIVEEVHHGQLIYSGGDDVLAMLPAENAVGCACDLRAAFQGCRANFSEKAQNLFKSNVPDGFLQLANPSQPDPAWPLLMPGHRMTVSVGLAIGHVKEPLQDMIQEAQRAEKRAKADVMKKQWNKQRTNQEWKLNEGWSRDALALTLFKRSGETIRWGAKFHSRAFPLLDYVQQHYRSQPEQPGVERPIHSSFPYRMAQLLGVYDTDKPLTEELRQIAEKEIAHVINRQTASDKEDELAKAGFSRGELERRCRDYLAELLSFKWDRPGDDGNSKKDSTAPRPLREFINLFLTEAFIRRQAD
ncbi:MAG: type III-B CRISPR-associated protein Cas10/Cmr2 [Limisphaerales bacterium]